MDKIQYAIESFKNIQELIKFCDQKAGALLVVYGFILTLFTDNSKLLVVGLDKQNPAISVIIFSIGIMLLLLMIVQSYLIIIWILKPQLANNYSASDSCLYYFEHIALSEKSELVTCINNLDDNRMLTDVSTQIFEVSKVLYKKMRVLGYSFQLTLTSIILLISFVLVIKLL